jgi:RimJ/RimL family protein N-acetyltransferase
VDRAGALRTTSRPCGSAARGSPRPGVPSTRIGPIRTSRFVRDRRDAALIAASSAVRSEGTGWQLWSARRCGRFDVMNRLNGHSRMTQIPILMTARLTLRAMALMIGRHMQSSCSRSERDTWGPFDVRVSWGMFCADHAQWDLFDCGALMIEDRETGACLGQVGINSGPLFPENEVGWLVYLEAEGQNYAHEAASALLDWARGVRKLDTLVSYVDPDNARSCRLAERLGAVLDHQAARSDATDLVFRHFG